MNRKRLVVSLRVAPLVMALLTLASGIWSPAAAASRPSELCVDLLKASSDGSVKFWVSGTGDSREMTLRVKNELTVALKICVEVGTRLKPKEGSVQAMVVTKEVKITLKAEAEDEVSLEVACLDITKDPPSRTNSSWTVGKPAKLVNFLDCVNRLLDEVKQQEPSHAGHIDAARQSLVQLSLWQARGATREDWIEFLVKYQSMSKEQATQQTDLLQPLLAEIVNQCGSLADL